MSAMRVAYCVLFALILSACGGGGTITREDGGQTGGGGNQTETTVTMSLTVTDSQGNIFNNSNPLTSQNEGTIKATLLQNNSPYTNQIVTVATEFTGRLDTQTGTATTDNDGVASVKLLPGTLKGAGRITVTFGEGDSAVTARANFFSSGDEAGQAQEGTTVSVRLLLGCNTGWDANRDNVKLDPTAAGTGCSEVTRLATTDLAEVFIEVNNAATNDGVANVLVNTTTNLGSILPSSGSAVTDNFGVALLRFQPGTEGGAGTLTATSQDSSGSRVFSIGVADLKLEVNNGLDKDDSGNDIPLKAGGSTIVTVRVLDQQDNLFTTPLDVELSSVCAASNLVELDQRVTTSQGVATSTYRANGCKIVDDVTVNVETGGRNFTARTQIPVESSPAQSLQYQREDSTDTSAFQSWIALPPGEGGIPTQSTIKFKLIDTDGNPVSQATIDFRLTDSVGKAGLTQARSSTNSEGIVQTTITSGVVPGPLVVQACLIPDDLIDREGNPSKDGTCWKDLFDRCTDSDTTNNSGCPDVNTLTLVPLDEQITSVSSRVTLATGITDQNSFDASPETFNTNSLYYNDVQTDITVFFGDQFNNFTAGGVTAIVEAEAGVTGTIDGTQFNQTHLCETTDGKCTIQWRSQGDRPFADTKWGNRIGEVDGNTSTLEGFNPKVHADFAASELSVNQAGNLVRNNVEIARPNCDPYFGNAAPCINGVTRIEVDATNGVILGGRVSILATAKGQENFDDKESTTSTPRTNGLFDIGEFFQPYDLGEPILDHNENGLFDRQDCAANPQTKNDLCHPANAQLNGGIFERWRDSHTSDNRYTAADGKYNGLLCSASAEQAGQCTKNLIEVRRNFDLVMSGDTPFIRAYFDQSSVNNSVNTSRWHVSSTCEPLNSTGAFIPSDLDRIFWVGDNLNNASSTYAGFCDVGGVNLSSNLIDHDNNTTTPEIDIGLSSISVTFLFSDEYGNPLPAGTSIAFETTNGELGGSSGISAVENTNSTSLSAATVTVTRESEGNDKNTGQLTLVLTIPGSGERPDKIVRQSIRVDDDR